MRQSVGNKAALFNTNESGNIMKVKQSMQGGSIFAMLSPLKSEVSPLNSHYHSLRLSSHNIEPAMAYRKSSLKDSADMD